VLYVIADLSAVWAEMQIYESDLAGVKIGMPVTIRSQDGRFRATGRLAHLRPVVDESSRTAEAHAEIPNPRGIWFPGMYVNLELVRSSSRVAVAIEPGALQQIDGKASVFVRTPAGFAEREVKLGQRGDRIEILSGLKAGESYAAANSFVLKSALLGED
jgi:cobalt-zinc-cadmium efflux system membrane fusion protein